MKFNPEEFARQWLSAAKEKASVSADPIMVELIRFFSVYVAFNCLYSPFKAAEKDSDCKAIESFLKRCFRSFGRYSIATAFSAFPHEEREIRDSPPQRFLLKDNDWSFSPWEQHEDAAIRLFERIHVVRCNLFHGMKMPHSDERDRLLVIECRIILEDFLDFYFKKIDSGFRVFE